MADKLKCEIVRDLLPSYVDNLTSDTTNQAIEAHVADCPKCEEVLQCMKEPDPKPEAMENEVDYLKKVRHNSTKTSLLLAIAMFVVSILLVFGKLNYVGTKTGWDSVSCNAEVTDNKVIVSGSMFDSARGIARISFEEKDGIVDVKIYAAPKTFLNKADFSKSYQAKGPVNQVRFNQYIIWENGMQIGRMASKLFADKNKYVGDMPANGQVAGDLAICDQFGPYKNELQTTKEPYGWTLILEDAIAKEDEDSAKQMMAADSYVMIAVIDNLGSVTWNYQNEAGRQKFTVTKEDATAFAGMDIKQCAATVGELQQLLQSLSIRWAGTKDIWQKTEKFYVEIRNQSDTDIYGMGIHYYLNGKLIGSRGGQNANSSKLKKGSKEQFDFIAEDFPEDVSKIGLSGFSFDLTIVDKNGKEIEVCKNRSVGAKYGWTFFYTLMNEADGKIVLNEG